MRLRLALAAALLAAAGLAALPAPPLPECRFEDGSGGPTPCIWHGDRHGTGEGRTYLLTEPL